MKPTNRLVIALVFLLVVVVIFVLVNKVDLGSLGGRGTEEAAALPTPGIPLFPASQLGEVTRVQVKDNTTGEIVVAEKKDGRWTVLKAPEGSGTGLGVDEMRITNAVSMIPSIQPSRSLTAIEGLAAYGLGDKAQYTVNLTIDGQDYALTIGSKNPGASDYYVQLSTVGDIYLVGTFYLDPVIELLTQPPYIQPTLDPNMTPSATPEGVTPG